MPVQFRPCQRKMSRIVFVVGVLWRGGTVPTEVGRHGRHGPWVVRWQLLCLCAKAFRIVIKCCLARMKTTDNIALCISLRISFFASFFVRPVSSVIVKHFISFHFIPFCFVCFLLRDARNEQCYEILSLLTKFDGVHCMLGVHCTSETRMEVVCSRSPPLSTTAASDALTSEMGKSQKKRNLITMECWISAAFWSRQRNAYKKSSKCNSSETAHIKLFAFVPFAVWVSSNSDRWMMNPNFTTVFFHSVAKRADVRVCWWRALL